MSSSLLDMQMLSARLANLQDPTLQIEEIFVYKSFSITITIKQIKIEEKMKKHSTTSSVPNLERLKAQHKLLRSKSKKSKCSLLKNNHDHVLSKIQNGSLKPQSSSKSFKPSQSQEIKGTKQLKKSEIAQSSETNILDDIKLRKTQKVKVSIQAYKLKNVSAMSNKQYIYEIYRGVKYSLQKLKPPTLQQVQNKSIQLFQPTYSKQKFLFLDLDQTLIYTQKTQNLAEEGKVSYKISIRPYTFTFLQKLSRFYELYVFTAATRVYAQAAINKINKNKPYIKDFLCRENCFSIDRARYLKDLRIIKNRELKDIVILDNTVEVFGLQLDNGIPILSFDGKTQDDLLLQLVPFLQQISKHEDVRPAINEKFKLKNMVELSKQEIYNYLNHRYS